MDRCPTCHRLKPPPTPPRPRVCWACGKDFVQLGAGRPRITCDDPKCLAKRKRYRKLGLADLDRQHGVHETGLPVPPRVFLHAIGRSHP